MRKPKFLALVFLLFAAFFPLCAQTFSETYYTLLPEGTDGTAGTDAQYVLFGDWPQSPLPYGVTVDEKKSIQVGAFTYFYGSDDCWYAKADYDYYKVEPIKWRIVTDNYNGNRMLLSENTLIFLEWYDASTASSRVIDGQEVYDNNYEYSKIRAYLNGLSYTVKESDNSVQLLNKEFLGKGFLQTAFTEYTRNYIADTKVDNSPENSATETGFFSYNTASLSASRDTVDKVFLLSRKEATTKKYGFTEYYDTGYTTARLRSPVPFASALQQTDNENRWWLRSPYAAFYSEPLYVDKNSTDASLLSSLGIAIGEERTLFIENAKTYLGVPYVYGGLSRNGIDCSGLTYMAAQAIRLQIPRTAALQYEASTHISDSDRQPGDLVFFSENGKKVSHVGIYLGNGIMLNSQSSGQKTGVVVADLSSPYWIRTYFGAGRIIEDSSASLAVTQQGSGMSGTSGGAGGSGSSAGDMSGNASGGAGYAGGTSGGAGVTNSQEGQESPLFNHATHYVFTVEGSGSMRLSEDGGAESSAGGGYYGVVPALCVTSDVPVLKSIEVAKKPLKTVYNAGEELDLTGLLITATYSDGKKREITRYTASGFNPDLAGVHPLTIQCAELLVEKELTVDYTVTFPFKGTFTGEFKGTEYTELPKGTDGTAGKNARYALFGDWPQTRKAAGISIDETKKVTVGGNTYYLGSDGSFYAKVTENAYSSDYSYSDGTAVGKGGTNSAYFKVEPVKWRIVTDDYDGNALLVAENILTTEPWYKGYDYAYSGGYSNSHRNIDGTTVYPNNYEYSTLRAFLNGLPYYTLETNSSHTQVVSSEFLDKGFLQSAFSKNAQNQIVSSIIDNSAESTAKNERWSSKTSKYLSDDTQDKIFLLSVNEITKMEYGFGSVKGSTSVESRARIATDFSKAQNLELTSGELGFEKGIWWLRSPFDSSWQSAYQVYEGTVETSKYETDIYKGIVPALCLPCSMVTPAEPPALESISIVSQSSSKKEYSAGESVSWIAMDIGAVIANYSDGSAQEVLEYLIKGFNSTKSGKHTVTISYTEDGVTKELPYNYTITGSASGASAETADYKVTITNNGRSRSISTSKISSAVSASPVTTPAASTQQSTPAAQTTPATNASAATSQTSTSPAASSVSATSAPVPEATSGVTSAVAGATSGAVAGAVSGVASGVTSAAVAGAVSGAASGVTSAAVVGAVSGAASVADTTSTANATAATNQTSASQATSSATATSTSPTSTTSPTAATSQTNTSASSPASSTSATVATTSQTAQARVSNTLRTGYTELPAGTDGSVGTSGKYVLFGEWPQSLKADDVTIDEARIKKSGAFTYYQGSDGFWYYEYYYIYFKVEPIKWRVLTDDYNGYTLLLAENSLLDCRFYDYVYNRQINGKVVYPNNYEHSRIRAFLNGLSYTTGSPDNSYQTTNSEFLRKGFLQTAFNNAAQKVIVPTLIDNGTQSTTDVSWTQPSAARYVCANTTDKIFLLSEKELTTSEYGFSLHTQADASRTRNATDYLEFTGEMPYSDWISGRYWWIRSPYDYEYADDGSCVRQVLYDGNVEEYDYINDCIDVVPALCIAK